MLHEAAHDTLQSLHGEISSATPLRAPLTLSGRTFISAAVPSSFPSAPSHGSNPPISAATRKRRYVQRRRCKSVL
jgi:hypothetical protein